MVFAEKELVSIQSCASSGGFIKDVVASQES